MIDSARTFKTAEERWAGIGPYYAMFPVSFANRVIHDFSNEGDVVLDPFAGRGTSVYSASTQGRIGIGIELNPVGWVYTKAKLSPSTKGEVIHRLQQIDALSGHFRAESDKLPEFFHLCFSPKVRQFLLAARKILNWRRCQADWTTAAILMVYLHGKQSQSLSNQMRQTKSLSPSYAVRWWKDSNHFAPKIDVLDFIQKRIEWRYAKGLPKTTRSYAFLGDSVSLLRSHSCPISTRFGKRVSLLFSSPPYCGVTNYFYDQWLRLWLLGYPPKPIWNNGRYRNKFSDKAKYKQLLKEILSKSALLLKERGIVYLRTDARTFTLQTTVDVLREVFPSKRMTTLHVPMSDFSQTKLFANNPSESGEVDLIVET